MKTSGSESRKRWCRGFTRNDVLAIIASLAVLGVLLLPLLAGSRRKESRINCANQLKQVGLAFKLWAGDHSDKFPMQMPVAGGGTLEHVATGRVFPHFQVMSNELATPQLLTCPTDTGRTNASNFTSALTDANISYWLGVDATDDKPSAWLAGDRNLSTNGIPVPRGLAMLTTDMIVGWHTNMHGRYGNVLHVDGSVEQPGSNRLSELLLATGMETNRLAVP